ncbi:MAG: AI-2E family transporter [Burkholderiales bacterium]|nr:AI-2E family transporter [Burkholderiales bacterium]
MRPSLSDRPTHAEQIIRLLVAAALLAGSLYVLMPLLAPIIWAAIFVISSWPLFLRLRQRVRNASAAATLATLVLLVLFAVPIALMATSLLDLADSALHYSRTRDLPGPPEFVSTLPWIGPSIAWRWNEAVADVPAFLASLRQYDPQIREFLLRVGRGLGQSVVLLLLSAVFAFFFFRDAERIGATLRNTAARIAAQRGIDLLHVAAATTRSVVYGIVGTAATQGALAAIGLAIAGVPAPLLLGLFVGMLALIPIGLTGVIMLPACAWLFMEGQLGWGVFLTLWAVFVVGGVDNFMRPLLISRGARLPLAVVLTGVLGGLLTMGVLGIFIGAVLLGVVYVMLRDWAEMQPLPAPVEQEEKAEETIEDQPRPR